MGNEDQPGGQSDDEEVVTGALYELTLRPEPPPGPGPRAAAAGSVIRPGLGPVLSGQLRPRSILDGTRPPPGLTAGAHAGGIARSWPSAW